MTKPETQKSTRIEPGYSIEEARYNLYGRFLDIAQNIAKRPLGASPSGYVMVELVQHPDRQMDHNFPHHFLEAMKLRLMWDIQRLVNPYRSFRDGVDGARFTTCLEVIGRKTDLGNIPRKIEALSPLSPAVQEMTYLESAALMTPESRLYMKFGGQAPADGEAEFKVTLTSFPNLKNVYPTKSFKFFAAANGFRILSSEKNNDSPYLQVTVLGPNEKLTNLAEFTFIRRIRRPSERLKRPYLPVLQANRTDFLISDRLSPLRKMEDTTNVSDSYSPSRTAAATNFRPSL